MEPSEYDNVARLQNRHWWYGGMTAISLALLRGALPRRGLRLLDAGCGAGGMLRHLAEYGQAAGIDLHPLALKHARAASPAPLARASVERLPFAGSSFDVVTSFDVLYHLSVNDDLAALREFARVLRRGGALLIRVPAWESLRGAHDDIVHTRHRYRAAELRAKLLAAGFRIERLTYANALLFIPIAIRRAVQRAVAAWMRPHTDVELPPDALNQALELALRLEARWLRRFDLPFGVSLLALART